MFRRIFLVSFSFAALLMPFPVFAQASFDARLAPGLLPLIIAHRSAAMAGKRCWTKALQRPRIIPMRC